MKLVTYLSDGSPRLGAVVGDGVLDLSKAADPLPRLESVKLLALIPRPRKNVFAPGRNPVVDRWA